jgi:DNA modification methylase
MKINIDEIKIIDRKRNAGDITQLSASINEIGLLQPITVTSDFRLIAGLHRLTACKYLGWQEIEVNVVDYDSEILSELAEIDENLIRNELTQFDKSIQTNRRKEIYEILHPHTAQGKTNNRANQHTIKNEESPQLEELPQSKTESFVLQTAKATNQSRQNVERNSRRGKVLKPLENLIKGSRFEDNGKELDELVKIADDKKGEGIEVAKEVLLIAIENKLKIFQAHLQYKKNRQIEVEVIEIPNVIINNNPVFDVRNGQKYKLGRHTLICGNSYDIINKITNIDALISDPPYGINYIPTWNKWDGSKGSFNKVIGDNELFNPADFLNFKTVLLFGANYFSDKLPLGGWLCWDKRTNELIDKMKGSAFELAWFRSHHNTQKSIMIRLQHGGVVNADSIIGNNEKRFHTTQKPVELMREILLKLTLNDEIIYDPFLGSGSTLLAAERCNRICIGSEMDENYCNIVLNRFYNETKIIPCLV